MSGGHSQSSKLIFVVAVPLVDILVCYGIYSQTNLYLLCCDYLTLNIITYYKIYDKFKLLHFYTQYHC